MALDKLVDSRQLDAALLSIANAIREKSGSARPLNFPADFVTEIGKLGGDGLTDEIKQAILQLGQKVAYIDAEGQAYYNDLYNALYPPKTVVLLTAVFRQGSTVIYDDTALDDLKQYLTVTAKYDDNTTAILADSAYSLSGLLEAPSSTVTVLYNGVSTTFSVTVTARPTLSSITAVYTQSGTVYDTDTLDSLKADLVVTAHYSDSSTEPVPAADYTLSGTLSVGTSTITVSYGGKTTTFTVTVTALRYITSSDIASHVGYNSITVANGTVTARSVETFAALTYIGDFLEFAFPEGYAKPRIVFKKDGDNYYATDSGNVYLFTKSGTKYTATSAPEATEITNDPGHTYVGGEPYTLSLDTNTGILTLAYEGEPVMTLTNANVLGYWGANNDLGKNVKFINAKVIDNS